MVTVTSERDIVRTVKLYKRNELMIGKIIRIGEEISANIKIDFKIGLAVKLHSNDVCSCDGSFHMEGSY
ncbi:hypothetical protein ACGE0T_05710 [Parabacteroides sp. APC149_11_2_Y6]